MAQELARADGAFVADWKALGSFNVAHPTIAGTRVISLNSIFMSQKYQALSSAQGCKPVASTAAADLMEWLEHQLAAAEQAHEKVWLMFHIPPGIDGYASAMKHQKLAGGGTAEDDATCAQSIVPMWKTEWTAQFDALLAKYQTTVAAAFAAHTHSDDFRVMGQECELPHLPTAGKCGPAAGFVLMNPAISPVYSQNPGFRVVSYRADGTLRDQSTYYLTNLPVASAHVKGQWKREYQFTRQWTTRMLDTASLNRVYDQVVASETARGAWLKLYAVSGPAEEGEQPIVRALYCAVEGLSVQGYQQCWCGKD